MGTDTKQAKAPICIYEEVFPGDTNAYGTAFGGKILSLMDRAAGLAASRYARCDFVTASLDALDFKAPVKQGEIAEVEAQVVYTSTHTCGIKVRVFAVDKFNWEQRQCCEGVFFMVAKAPGGPSKPVPKLEPSTEEEQRTWEQVQQIHKQMLHRRTPRG